jgi:5'(3')-deoxyribonucleotidase
MPGKENLARAEESSKEMKPTCLIDVDGVLANFVGAALKILKEKSGIHVEHDQITVWDLYSCLPEKAQQYVPYIEWLLKARGGCLSMSPYEGAQEGFKKLEEIAEVVIVTSPYPGSETWHSERERWLEKHFGVAGHRVIHTHQKQRVSGDFLIDDKTSHITKWADAHPNGQALLWNMRYNEQDDLAPANASRVMGWDQLLARVGLWVPR